MKEFKAFDYEIKELTGEGLVTFYANAFNNLDSDGDISMPGSFKKTLKENGKRLRHLKWHDMRYMPGAIKEIKEDDFGLLVISQLIMDTQLGKETYAEYRALSNVGKQMEHSVAVIPVKYDVDQETEQRTVSEWKLFEVSTLTAWGANSQALTVDIKSLEDYSREDIEQDILTLRAMLDIKCYDDIKLEYIEKQINYLNRLKADKQPDLKGTTDEVTFSEFKAILKLK